MRKIKNTVKMYKDVTDVERPHDVTAQVGP